MVEIAAFGLVRMKKVDGALLADTVVHTMSSWLILFEAKVAYRDQKSKE